MTDAMTASAGEKKTVNISDNTDKYPDMGQENPRPVEKDYVPVGTPIAWRELINEQLGEDFEVICDGMVDRPSTRVTIIVPEKYWSGKPEEIADRKEKGKKDERSLIIQNALALNQLKDWIQKIKENIHKGINSSSEPLKRIVKE